MDKKGFTLIEIIVSIAILSILAGVMVPLVYRVWESNEIAATRTRMADLKTAIAGARDLYQQGVRSHYGFVGDIGALPNNLDDLVIDTGAWAGWRGPYLGGGFNATTYKLDAWSNPIAYTEYAPPLIVAGEEIAATLRSSGPDRTFGTADDIDENSDLALQILSKEIWPLAEIQGNLTIMLTATTTATPQYYSADLYATFRDGIGFRTVRSTCFRIKDFDESFVVEVNPDETKPPLIQPFDEVFQFPLPIGKIMLRSRLFGDVACSGTPIEETGDMAIFVNDGLKVLSVNPPTLYHRIN
ncbi:MAG: prepilin-type N-terminal cleavage/methylation domain-containing protein [Desulfuromonadales bacterium]|nr:prepilin-type N-terminal cleavage/methylation domain-containing protein [Desulfuromonadales bacterium]